MKLAIEIPRENLKGFCQRNHIKRLSFFGSVLRDDFTAKSDIDVLVEFESGHTPGLAFFAMQEELTTLFGQKVDLNTPAFLSQYFKEKVLEEAEEFYHAA